MPKISTSLGIIILVVAGILAETINLAVTKNTVNEEITTYREIQRTSQTAFKNIVADKALYIIDWGQGDRKSLRMTVSPDSTVFSLLEEFSRKGNFGLATKDYPEMGVFVESISQKKGGDGNRWWQYWVNDKLGEVAADKKQIKPGDKVEWRYEIPLQF